MKKVVSVLSGGLDSTILTYDLVDKFGKDNVIALSYFYGQKQSIELERAAMTCKKLGIRHELIDISFLGEIVKPVCSNVVGTDVEVPTYEEVVETNESATEVPYRNLILASIAFSFAQSNGCSEVYSGLQAHDHDVYWDCRPSYIKALNDLSELNTKAPVKYCAPFSSMTKKDELVIAEKLGVDYSLTLTCYNPDDKGRSCGVCPSCGDRINGFKQAGVVDTVEYQ